MKELLELEHVKEAYIRYITKLELKENENTFMLFLKDFLFYYFIKLRHGTELENIIIKDIEVNKDEIIVTFLNYGRYYSFVRNITKSKGTYKGTVKSLKSFLEYYEI